MPPTASSPGAPPELTEKQKAALVQLLADDDIAIYHMVRSKILAYGHSASSWVQPHTLSSDPVLRRRAIEIIQHLARQAADNRFLGFCLRQGDELDLEEGTFLLAQTQYPEINLSAYQALLDCYAADLKERLQICSSAEAIIGTINQYVYKEQGYHGNEQNYYEPDNSYLNRVMDRRKGNPISLCIVWLCLARRLQLPISGIGMPGHFLCRYQSSTEEFYIDAFNEGKLLTKGDCVKYLLHTHDGFKESYLAPVSPRRILLRVCSNLHQIYTKLNLGEEQSRFQSYIVALAK
ncbi:MAG: transglutaminase-like domain-containing protein [Verrucomicrobiota bacterium]|nr:transglutaminase-like domain-containing protein [Verrucomicrobiota bacterium]